MPGCFWVQEVLISCLRTKILLTMSPRQAWGRRLDGLPTEAFQATNHMLMCNSQSQSSGLVVRRPAENTQHARIGLGEGLGADLMGSRMKPLKP